MLPYFRSMEAFFDLSLPKSWADLSDTQLLFFFRQLATDKPAPPIGEVLRTAMNAQIRALTGGDYAFRSKCSQFLALRVKRKLFTI